jgi:hypothetical protein
MLHNILRKKQKKGAEKNMTRFFQKYQRENLLNMTRNKEPAERRTQARPPTLRIILKRLHAMLEHSSAFASEFFEQHQNVSLTN